MRRVWAAVLAVWATLAIVAVLAWSHQPPRAVTQGSPVTVVVRGKNGTTHLARVFVLAPGTAAHAGTHSSPSTGSTPAAPQSGNVFVSAQSAPIDVATGTS